MSLINIAPSDLNLGVSQALPAAGTNVTTGIIDLQAIAPNSSAWRLGMFRIYFPNVPENTAGAGITVALEAAPPSLTTGATAAAPATPPPGTFITPPVAQTLTVAAVGSGGSLAANYYMHAALDSNGSTYQFYKFVVTTPAEVAPNGEEITIEFIPAAG